MDGRQAMTTVTTSNIGRDHGRGRAAARRITTEGDAYDMVSGETYDASTLNHLVAQGRTLQ
jgi:hypothetical protein